jgi:hypothetical protein
VLALAAAGSVLEVDGAVHRLSDLGFFLLRKVFVCALVLSGRGSLPDNSLCSGSNGPDEAQ